MTGRPVRCSVVNTMDKLMKTVLALIGAVTLAAGSLVAGPDVIILQRARELRDQNNVQQGVTPPGQPTQPVQPATTSGPG